MHEHPSVKETVTAAAKRKGPTTTAGVAGGGKGGKGVKATISKARSRPKSAAKSASAKPKGKAAAKSSLGGKKSEPEKYSTSYSCIAQLPVLWPNIYIYIVYSVTDACSILTWR